MGSNTKKHKDKDKDRDRGRESRDGKEEDRHKRKHRSKDREDSGKHDDDVVILEQTENNNNSNKERSRKRRHRDSSPEVVAISSSIRETREKSGSKRATDDGREDRRSSSRKHSEKRRHSSGDNDNTDVTPTKRSKGLPKQKQGRPPSPVASGSGAGDSLSIDETNKLRIKLGLKPLQIDSGPPKRPPPQANKEDTSEAEGDIDEETANRIKAERELENETYWKQEHKDFVHAPATNIGKEKQAEKLRDKFTTLRERRKYEEKLKATKGLADDSDDDDSAAKWVAKQKKLAEDKVLAEKRAKALEELDDSFGVGDLVESEFQKAKSKAYTEKHLKGLKVMHSDSRITEGESVIMTLEDKDVLDEKDDVLINVNMVDDEKYEKNIEDRKMRPELHGYNVFEDLEFDPANQGKKVLAKYDEEIEGAKRKTFVIGEDLSEIARKAKIRDQMQKANKILESVEAPTLKIASDFLTEEEMFKKRTRKVRKVRKKLKADDLLMDNVQNSSSQDLGSRKSELEDVQETKVKSEPVDMEIDMEIDDLPASMPMIDVSDIKLEDEGDLDFQLALSNARKLKQGQNFKKRTVEKLAELVHSDQNPATQSTDISGDTMVLNATAEFCRTLGDIPSFSGGDIYGDEAMDFEAEAKAHRDREEFEERGKWNAVEIDEAPIDITNAPTELEKAPILEEEPEVGSGIAGALKLAVKKGFLEHEKKKRAAARTMKHLEAQNYSIDDKNYEEDRSHNKREFYSGPTTEFKEKSHYKPEVKLEYTDDDGRPISAKEAFRLLSHKFHGKGSGKNKIDKKRRKAEQDKLMQHMSSSDTPLGTLELLQERQKATHSAYIVLSGSNKASQHALSKPSKR